MESSTQWETDIGEWIRAEPTVVDGTVYIGTDDGTVHALDGADGSEQWTFEGEDTVGSAPTVVDETVLVGCEDGCLYALDGANGNEQWRFELDSLVYDVPSPAVLSGTVYVGAKESGNDHVYALDIADGSKHWHREMDGGIPVAPTIVDRPDGRTLVVVVSPTTGDCSLVALDGGDGSERWRVTTESPLETAPLVTVGSEPTVLLPSRHHSMITRAFEAMADDSTATPPSVEREQDREPGGNIAGFDLESGEQRLDVDSPGPPVTTPTVADGTLYAGTENGRLFAADVETGDVLWEEPVNFQRLASADGAPTVVDEQVIVGTDEGALLGFDTDDAELLWAEPLGASVAGGPTVVDGTAYVGARERVLAVDIPGCSASSRGDRLRRGVLGHHDETVHERPHVDTDGVCPNCRQELSAIEDPAYCWACGWEL